MFLCIATKPLNDGTNGFRFNFVGIKGLTRKRKTTKRFGITTGDCTKALHFGFRSIYIEQKRNKTTKRRIRHFAG